MFHCPNQCPEDIMRGKSWKELFEHPTNCPDCGGAHGRYHKPGCDIERCAACGGQYISCDCGFEESRENGELEKNGIRPVPPDDRMPWSGHWPGDRECVEFGFFARRWDGPG